jgi:single-stranded-DNA-specific exonuclease
MAVGSGRSIESFNLHRALTKLEHLFERFGGHYHAVGFALDMANIDVLAKGLEGLAQEALSEDDLIPKIEIDAEVSLPDLTLETVNHLESLSPFGPGNPEPIFCSKSMEVIESRVVGEKHLKLRVRQGRSVMEAIGFGLSHKHPLKGETIRMAFTPEINQWKGFEKIQLRIIDLKVMD